MNRTLLNQVRSILWSSAILLPFANQYTPRFLRPRLSHGSRRAHFGFLALHAEIAAGEGRFGHGENEAEQQDIPPERFGCLARGDCPGSGGFLRSEERR